MKIHIESERLIIRTPVIEDHIAVNQAIVKSLPELRTYMPWADKAPTLEETKINLQQAIELAEKDVDIRLLAFSRENGKFISSSGLHKIEWRIPRAEIGYWVRTTECGKGYAFETAQAITDYAMRELKFRRLEIIVSESNVKSWKIAEKLGYTLEAKQPLQRVNPDGSIDGTRLYAKVTE